MTKRVHDEATWAAKSQLHWTRVIVRSTRGVSRRRQGFVGQWDGDEVVGVLIVGPCGAWTERDPDGKGTRRILAFPISVGLILLAIHDRVSSHCLRIFKQ